MEQEWIVHDGKGMPVPAGAEIYIRFRMTPEIENYCSAPERLRWSHLKSETRKGDGDIIAYRVVSSC